MQIEQVSHAFHNGIGGMEATITDASLALGCINLHYFCGGMLEADMSEVDGALDKLAALPLPIRYGGYPCV